MISDIGVLITGAVEDVSEVEDQQNAASGQNDVADAPQDDSGSDSDSDDSGHRSHSDATVMFGEEDVRW